MSFPWKRGGGAPQVDAMVAELTTEQQLTDDERYALPFVQAALAAAEAELDVPQTGDTVADHMAKIEAVQKFAGPEIVLAKASEVLDTIPPADLLRFLAVSGLSGQAQEMLGARIAREELRIAREERWHRITTEAKVNGWFDLRHLDAGEQIVLGLWSNDINFGYGQVNLLVRRRDSNRELPEFQVLKERIINNVVRPRFDTSLPILIGSQVDTGRGITLEPQLTVDTAMGFDYAYKEGCVPGAYLLRAVSLVEGTNHNQRPILQK